MVTDSFAVVPNALLNNPDLKPGINLHIDVGPDSVMNPVTGAKWNALSQAGEVPFQSVLGSEDSDGIYNWSAFDAVKALRFGPAKRSAVFHDALFCNTFADQPSSGIARRGSADFIISLGKQRDAISPGGTVEHLIAGGTVTQQAGTFMHEFGHNLGLEHGGADSISFKPNYLSVM